MNLICYLQPGWAPLIRPAPATRPWMDDTPEAFAYRCLPLNIANAHGWEVLSPCGFSAVWSGESDPGAVSILPDPGEDVCRAPVSLFGQGVVTFHIEGLIRTPPGWNVWVGGSPNRPKDGIQALSGIVETDWSPFTFTMNWRFTRPDHWVRFERFEPIAFFFPVERGAIDAFSPRFEPIESDPNALEGFNAWSRARDAFHTEMKGVAATAGAEKWQKHYYRGVDVAGRAWVDDHQSKLRLAAFDRSAAPSAPAAPLRDEPPPQPRDGLASASADHTRRDLARREWLLETAERQRALSSKASAIDRIAGLSGQDFLDHYYAPCRPVILAGEMALWPALTKWTPDYLKSTIGGREVDFEVERRPDAGRDRPDASPLTRAAFSDVIDRVSTPTDGDIRQLSAGTSDANAAALSPLHTDLGALGKFLNPGPSPGQIRIGSAGARTSLHYGLSNSLLAQIVGRSRLLIGPASEVGRLYNRSQNFSDIADIEAENFDGSQYSRLNGAKMYAVTLEPGEIIFLPFGWWLQTKALTMSITATYTHFIWPNGTAASFPSG